MTQNTTENLSPIERTNRLLSQMTLDEKIGQLLSIWGEEKNIVNNYDNISEELKERIIQFKVGNISQVSLAAKGPTHLSSLHNSLQKFIVENTRLKIPILCIDECLHGHAAKEANSFSQPIGLASTWNPQLVQELYRMAGKEARAQGVHLALTPVADIARDARWGRVEETFGEDPYLVSKMVTSAVKGLQGAEDGKTIAENGVMSCLKHFAGHGHPEAGTNCGSANYSERTYREVHLFPFKKAIKNANPRALMPAYHEIDGIPAHANKWLLQDILFKEWGFKGIVVSDYFAIEQLYTFHMVAKDKTEASLLAFKAGVDIDLPWIKNYTSLKELHESGKITLDEIDDKVRKVLAFKFELGLFENPYVDEAETIKIIQNPESKEVCLQGALESIILLKNQGKILPINKNEIKSIAVIGPNAEAKLFGGYTSTPPYFVTVLEGIKNHVSPSTEVLQSLGCKIVADLDEENVHAVKANDINEDNINIEKAVAVAKKVDIVILAIGGNERTSREGWSRIRLGDRANLGLFGQQKKLINEVLKVNQNCIAVMINGSPIAIPELAEKCPAILECWYLGQECGNAIAKVLFGEYSPSGKLPISIPRSSGHTPCYYNHKPNDRRGYLMSDIKPLYPFGFGLSYSSFSITNIKVVVNELTLSDINSGSQFKIMVTIKNTGDASAHEVIQLYIRDQFSSVTRPVKELKSFKKVLLQKDESRELEFTIGKEELEFYSINNCWEVEAGKFDILVGNSSDCIEQESVVSVEVIKSNL